MASTRFEAEAAQTLEAFGAELIARRAAVEAREGVLDVPRNAGRRRTAGKLALLKDIGDVGGRW